MFMEFLLNVVVPITVVICAACISMMYIIMLIMTIKHHKTMNDIVNKKER